MAENQVSVTLDIEAVEALKTIAKTQSAIAKLARDSKKDVEKVEGSFVSLEKIITGVFGGNLLTKAYDSLIGSIAQIPSVIVDITQAGVEAEESTKRLSFALAQAGDNSEQTLLEFEALATGLSQLIGVEDEAVSAGLRLALQFGATKEQARQIAITAADVAASGLLPFDEAVQQLSSTLNGTAPRAFARSVEGIKGLSEESLRSGEAIDIVAKRFRDFAAINSSNLSVQISNIGINFGELAETLGKVVAKNPVVRALFTTINESLIAIQKQLQENGPAVERFVTDFTQLGVFTLQTVVQIIDGTIRLGAVFKNVFEQIVAATNLVFGSIVDLGNLLVDLPNKILSGNLSASFDNTTNAVKELKEQSLDLEKSLDFSKPFTSTAAAVDTFTVNFVENMNKQTEAVNFRNEALGNGDATIQAASEAEIQRISETALELAALKDEEALNDLARQQMLDENIFTSAQTLAENKQTLALQEIQNRFALEEQKNNLIKNADERNLAQAKTAQAKKNAIDRATTQFELEQQRIRQQNFKDSLNVIASLQSSGSKELFAIGKAAAIATATIDGIQAVQKALASAPPPFNFVMAALVGTAQAINLSKIASAKPPAFADGGIVPGSSFSGDKVTARLNSGEMVLNSSQQAQLFNLANGGPAGSNIEGAIDRLGNRIASMNIVVQANAREIARLVRDEREAGFA